MTWFDQIHQQLEQKINQQQPAAPPATPAQGLPPASQNVFAQRAGMTSPQAPMAGAGGPVASPIMAGGFRPQMPMQQFGGPTPGMPSGMPMGMPQGPVGNPIMTQPAMPQPMPGQMPNGFPPGQQMPGAQMSQSLGMDPNTLNMLRARTMGTM
jgi:hypothetical protein